VRAQADGRIRAASIPHRLANNPYLTLLQDALARRGIETVDSNPRPGWAWRARSTVSVAHLHWIEFFVNGRGPRAARRPWLARPLYVARAVRFLAALVLLRTGGVRIVWTVHNLRPHEQQFPALERLLHHAVARLSHGLVVHSEYARRRLLSEYGWTSSTYWVAPHGSYLGSYPPSQRGRDEIRAELGIPLDAFVFLIFGQLRPYKRLDEAIRAFRQIDELDIRLVVAGTPVDEVVRDRVLLAAHSDPRVHLLLDYVDDSDVAGLHAMADAAIVSYVEAFSSGALLLALSHGLPVVAPRESSAPETAQPPALVTFSPGRLREALMDMRTTVADAHRAAALEAAKRLSWHAAAERVHAAYEGRDPDSVPATRRRRLRARDSRFR
jgi:glycosyltransferase involved in cell wall biosynthesis